MSYIPNVREKFKTPLFKNTQGAAVSEKEPNYYWQGYLDEKGAQFLAGFDMSEKGGEQNEDSFGR